MLNSRQAHFRPSGADPVADRILRPSAWGSRPDLAGPDVAILLTGVDDPAGAARAYRSVLPRAEVWLFDDGLAPEIRDAAARAGVTVRAVPSSDRDTLVRRMLAEVEADVYVLAHGAGADDACVAALLLAEVEAGRDLVDVRRFGEGGPEDAGERLLRRAVDFLYGGHGAALRSDFKACSRRFAVSYRRTAPRPAEPSARALALHALRLRLAVGHVAALGGPPAADMRPARGFGSRAATFALVARLAIEERPRRVCGLAGLSLAGAGLAAAAPGFEGGRIGPVAALLLALAGVALGAAGVALDALASARQEVRRLGAAAIPRRVERRPGGSGQSSVS